MTKWVITWSPLTKNGSSLGLNWWLRGSPPGLHWWQMGHQWVLTYTKWVVTGSSLMTIWRLTCCNLSRHPSVLSSFHQMFSFWVAQVVIILRSCHFAEMYWQSIQSFCDLPVLQVSAHCNFFSVPPVLLNSNTSPYISSIYNCLLTTRMTYVKTRTTDHFNANRTSSPDLAQT